MKRAILVVNSRILSTELAPCHDLDGAGLSGHCGMSPTPLREILLRLQGEGHVQMSKNCGAMMTATEAREGALAIDLTLQHWDLSRDHGKAFAARFPMLAGIAMVYRCGG